MTLADLHRQLDPAVFIHTSSAGLPGAAALLAAAGLPVFPCAVGHKRPLTRHGFHDATADPDQVASWWHRWPEANIGVATGCGIDVLDVDRHTDRTGFPALARLHRAGLTLGWIATVRSPSGGLHLYYPSPAVGQDSWSRPGAQIDFRGDRGYVIAAPSRILRPDGSRAEYRLIATRPIGRPVDAETIRDILTPPRRPAPAESTTGSRDVTATIDRLAGWGANLAEGSRNTGLFWAACRAAELNIDAAAALTDAGTMAGLEHWEAATTVASAYRKIAQAATVDTATAPGAHPSRPRAGLTR
jgi:hypothetical protein